MSNRFQPIPASTPPDQQLAMINNNFAQLDNENVKKLFYDVNGTPSIFIGIDQDQASVIKVAKPGVDVTTATNDQLAFNSAQDVFKVVASGTASISAPSASTNNSQATATTNATVTHGLGYTPAVLAFLTLGSNVYRPIPYTVSGIINSTVGNWTNSVLYYQVDSTSLTLISQYTQSSTTSQSGSGLGGTIKYYLLQETAN